MARQSATRTTRRPATPAKATPRRRAEGESPDAQALLGFYRSMLLIRRFEERAGQLYGMGLIGGFCHLYIGQEAIAVGMQAAKREGDQVITGYREHGHMLAAGVEPRLIMAELTGRAEGVSHGKGGSMHMFSTQNGFYGGHGIVGAQVSLGTGLALADRYRGDGKVAFVYFGDGAANQGQVYESFNMAELWRLPVIYVIENNQYAMGTSVARSSSETHLFRRGASFNIPGAEVDGMDVVAVRDAGLAAAEHARSGKGPYILEMKTYRYRGHSMSDPGKYRTREEIDAVRKTRDPIEHLQERLESQGLADEAALRAIDGEVKSVIADAAEFARTAPEPDPSELYTDIYTDRPASEAQKSGAPA
jgi:pyruvate dehydrogenase E1 component alpha subunit